MDATNGAPERRALSSNAVRPDARRELDRLGKWLDDNGLMPDRRANVVDTAVLAMVRMQEALDREKAER